MTKLTQGLSLAAEFTRRTPAQACNQAGLEVALAAQKGTPFVTVETIDQELNVGVEVQTIGVRGGVLKKPKRKFFGKVGTASGAGQIGEVPLAVLIIAARSRPGSNYNLLTNNRYAISAWPFKGVSRAKGAERMRQLIHDMIAARHKSGHFLRAGWSVSISDLLDSDRGRKYGSSSGRGEKVTNEELGRAIPAQTGNPVASCLIENDVGGAGKNSASHNRALNNIAGPPLQAAVNKEGAEQMQYFLDRAGKEELETPINTAWK